MPCQCCHGLHQVGGVVDQELNYAPRAIRRTRHICKRFSA
ncbi:IS66 family transposase zinc-finger binding domain-containing protein [Undibacterium sp. LX40W]|uniref:IS66 family transposase zinc-finger binding domain-containing protein n=1 Tax=Undibacterium nitidum TaxID=2762298 RepID=A0A923HND6_9BURK|nr:IS66 family transposase zinc-finger binding domain-containing protein [Undibacterium nitidum]MBC3890281.1 IS66 family transposase zinc-finger binding domain-containing protein [Undibacterium sp. LX40W]